MFPHERGDSGFRGQIHRCSAVSLMVRLPYRSRRKSAGRHGGIPCLVGGQPIPLLDCRAWSATCPWRRRYGALPTLVVWCGTYASRSCRGSRARPWFGHTGRAWTTETPTRRSAARPGRDSGSAAWSASQSSGVGASSRPQGQRQPFGSATSLRNRAHSRQRGVPAPPAAGPSRCFGRAPANGTAGDLDLVCLSPSALKPASPRLPGRSNAPIGGRFCALTDTLASCRRLLPTKQSDGQIGAR